MKKLFLFYLDLKYVRNLSKEDDNVMSISPQRGKEKRPFVGVVVLVNGREYCIPLTSPKSKFQNMKSKVDLLKIYDNSSNKLIGVLNINNMIPVNEKVIKKVNLIIRNTDSEDVIRRKSLMQKQLRWCRKNSELIQNRANKVYKLVTTEPEKNYRLTCRSSDFIGLEAVLDRYSGENYIN